MSVIGIFLFLPVFVLRKRDIRDRRRRSAVQK